MPQYISTLTSKEISDQIKTDLGMSLQLDTSNDSMTSILSKSLGDQLSSLNNSLKMAYEASFISTATGTDLDRLAIELFDFPRLKITTPSCSSSDRNVHIMVNPLSGYSSFRQANGGNPISIPKGTIISDRRNNENSISRIQYTTTEDVILRDTMIAYIGVRALTPGSSLNIGPNILKELEFYDYENYRNNVLLVNNAYPIINGQEQESDENYKYRLRLFLNSRNKINYNSIRLAALNTPGVIDTKIIQGYRGVGTIGVILFGANKIVDNQMIKNCESNINSSLRNTNVVVSAGVYLFLNMTINLLSTKRYTPLEETKIKNLISDSINSFFVNYTSDTINIRQLQNRIANDSFSSFNVIFDKTKSIISDIKLKRTTNMNSNDYVLTNLVGDFLKINDDERILPGTINLNITYLNGV